MGRPSAHEFSEFCGLLASAVERSVPLERAVGIIGAQLPSASFRAAVADVAGALEEGTPLADALGRRPKSFPPEFCAQVGAGQESGRLAEILRHAQAYHSLRSRLARGVRRLAVYVGVILLLCVASFGVVVAFARQFSEMFQQISVPIPGPTMIVMQIARIPLVFPLVILFVVVLGFFGWIAMRFMVSMSSLGYLVPAWGRLQRSRDMGLFCTVMSLGLEAGRPLADCLEAAAKSIPNRYARHVIGRVR
ncbi:MAG: type II secretion system F family protein, partial [Planctomycetota bacterium]